MKLRNKKTGEIIETDYELSVSVPDGGEFYGNHTYTQIKGYSSIKELSEEWEDYKEAKKHYEILGIGVVIEQEDSEDEIFRNQNQREIGNYFESKEEAEKVVEKLKAWKRLKDKGFRFKKWDYSNGMHIDFEFTKQTWATETEGDLDLLFGDEE